MVAMLFYFIFISASNSHLQKKPQLSKNSSLFRGKNNKRKEKNSYIKTLTKYA